MQVLNGFLIVKDNDSAVTTLIKISTIEKVVCYKDRIFVWTGQEEPFGICDTDSNIGISYKEIMEALGLKELI